MEVYSIETPKCVTIGFRIDENNFPELIIL
jgi:hypothetical protein